MTPDDLISNFPVLLFVAIGLGMLLRLMRMGFGWMIHQMR